MPSPSDKKRRRKHKDAERAVHVPAVSDVRRAAKAISRVSDLYGGGETGRLMDDSFATNPKVKQLIQRRHSKLMGSIDAEGVYHRGKHAWKVPLGVRLSMKRPLVWTQVVNKYPWYVTWRQNGKRCRKLFGTPLSAIDFIATKAQYVDKGACIVSRQIGYDIPAPLRGKLPLPWRWCPYCMSARKYKVVYGETFVAVRKEWSEARQQYVFVERKLQLLRCPRCRMTNRDPRFRRSNQPWETRRFKPSVRRARSRRSRS